MQPPDGSYSEPGSPAAPTSQVARVAHLRPAEARESFLDFLQREHIRVIVFLMACGATYADAEDAVQEAFIDAWRLTQKPGGWESLDEPRGWIRTVALRKYYHICRESIRRTRVVTQITQYIPRIAPVEHSELTIQAEYIRSILRELDPETRAVMAFHIDRFTSAEIARELKISSQKARDLTKKGRKALKAGLIALREQDKRSEQ